MEEYKLSNEKKILEIKNFSKSLKKKILEMAFSAGSSSSHLGGALSIVDAVSVLFKDRIKYDKKNLSWSERDRFILSKGHACLVYYGALNLIGILSDDQLKTFEKDDTNLPGHPVKNKDLGIDFSNGSLGMGLSIGVGVALSAKKQKKNFSVYVVLGDGECNEGSIWEAAMLAPNLNLDNLFVLIDKNKFQQTGSTDQILNNPNLGLKWSNFGWHVSEIDGHNFNEILETFDKIDKQKKPKVIILNTIKGKGFSFSENNNEWHHNVMTKKTFDMAIEELEKNGD